MKDKKTVSFCAKKGLGVGRGSTSGSCKCNKYETHHSGDSNNCRRDIASTALPYPTELIPRQGSVLASNQSESVDMVWSSWTSMSIGPWQLHVWRMRLGRQYPIDYAKTGEIGVQFPIGTILLLLLFEVPPSKLLFTGTDCSREVRLGY